MAGEKEIRNKIRSVRNMQKITKAMEMVAASKIRKAQAQMEASRPYAERIRRVIVLMGSNRFFRPRPVQVLPSAPKKSVRPLLR